MKKKVIAMLLAIGMATSLSACGGSEESDTNVNASTDIASSDDSTLSEEEAAAGIDLSENLTISLWQITDDYHGLYTDYAENPVMNWMAEKFNITLELQQPPMGSESEQINLMFGTGDYTDFVSTTYCGGDLGMLYEDDVIRDLAPYLERHMPNYYAYLNAEENKDVKAALYDDEGHLFTIATVNCEEPYTWGGLMYRKDILETMTEGNIAFPSGEEEPVTIEDWEYMLDLMKTYFEASGMTDTACLILPSTGYFSSGELLAGFGIGGTTYIDEEGNVQCGIASDNMYNYLVKMKEWYEAGYIYQDFASRTQDVFYLPNTALTYGGAAGIWYGFASQLGSTMSLPEYGLNIQMEPLSAPLDTEHGITGEEAGALLYSGRASVNSGWAATTACGEEELIRMMTALDTFYTDEGRLIKQMGLSTAEDAAGNPILQGLGLTEGTRITGTSEWTDKLNNDSSIDKGPLIGLRMPGLSENDKPRAFELADGVDLNEYGSQVWSKYGTDRVLPSGVTDTVTETNYNSTAFTNITDYANSMIPQFITGKAELTEESFQAYVDQMYALGLQEYLDNKAAAYERYLGRMN